MTAPAGTGALEENGHLASIDAHIPALSTDGSGNLKVNVVVGGGGGGTASTVAIADGTTSTQKMTVDANGYAAAKIKGDFAEQASLTAGSLNADLVPSTDVSAYKCFSIQLTGTWVGTITFQCSNDGTNWKALNLFQCDSGSTVTNNTGSTTVYFGAIYFRFLRIRMTGYTSGTATGTLELYTHTIPIGNTLNSVQINSGTNLIGGTNLVDSAGTNKASISAAGAVKVDGSAVTQPVSGTGSFTVAQSTAASLNTTATIQATTGTSLAADQTNSELRVSNYVTKTTAGDTALTLGQATKANSLPITIASDQGNIAQNLAQVGGSAIALGSALSASSLPVVVASDQASISVKQGVGASAGTNWRMAGDFTEQTGLSAGSLNADLVAAVDVSAYKWGSVQATGTWSGTLTVQGSNDNSNFVSVLSIDPNSINSSPSATFTTNSIRHFPIMFRYLRIRMTGYTSGTATGVLELYTTTSVWNGMWTVQPGNTANTTPWYSNSVGTTGGTSDYHLISTASTNANSIKASAGQVYGYEIYNTNAAARFVKLYNKASAPTVGTDTPFRTIGVAPNSRVSGTFSNGIAFATGIAIATTTGIADTDSTAVGASDLSIDIDYK